MSLIPGLDLSFATSSANLARQESRPVITFNNGGGGPLITDLIALANDTVVDRLPSDAPGFVRVVDNPGSAPGSGGGASGAGVPAWVIYAGIALAVVTLAVALKGRA